MEIIELIRPELLVLSVVLYGIGALLKKSKLKDNFIPLILGAIGIVVAIIYLGLVEGWTWAIIGMGAVQGILCASASNYVNQVIKQLLKLHNIDDKTAETIINAIAPEKEEGAKND